MAGGARVARINRLVSLVATHGQAIRNPAIGVHPLPATDLVFANVAPRTGDEVNDLYGPLLHYTTAPVLRLIIAAGQVGRPGAGVFLTPSPFPACIVPYELGLDSPRDVCLVVNTRRLPKLYGPASAGPSSHARLWRGGAIEFFTPSPIPLTHVLEAVEVGTCGDL